MGFLDLCYGHAKPRLLTKNNPSLAILTHPWLSLPIPGHPYPSLAILTHPWLSLPTPGYPYLSLAILTHTWLPLPISGYVEVTRVLGLS